MDQIRSNQPNAAKLISSLRNTGYDSYSAIEDIIDNSIDAQARNIKVNIEQKDKNICIFVADDGIGMNEAILDEALKLGSITDRDQVSDLGRYGMGLCTASISMAKKLEVITQEIGSNCLYSSQDLDEIVEKNDFIKILREANSEEKELLHDLCGGENGTIVRLSKIDRLSDNNLHQFADKLAKDLSRIYRKFITAGITLYVNDKKIGATDPLMQDNSETKIYSDEVYELPLLADSKKKEKIGIKIAILPEVNDELKKEMKMNIRNQGFYILRNNREIASGQTLDLFSKHNDFNRLRLELSFSATLDNEMGVRFSKDGIRPNQSITDFLKQEVGGQISSIRNILLKNKRADKTSIINHSDSEEVIAQRSKLLITPKAEIEKRGPRKNKEEEGDEPSTGKTRERKNYKETKTSPSGIGARFESSAMGREGTLYECYQEGKIIIVRWNTDHPFYDKVVLANKDSKSIVSALDYLVFALASAELKTGNDDNIELISTIKSIMSSNLRALLS